MNATFRSLKNIAVLISSLCLHAAALSANAASWTVISSADNGLGSLRDTVTAAASGDTVGFAIGGTITLTNGPVSINQDLTIAGPGAEQLTVIGTIGSTNGVDGVTNGTAFSICSNRVVTISGLTITGESYGNGGGVNNCGSLKLLSCVVSNCLLMTSYSPAYGYSSSFGGGIYSTGDMLLKECLIENNQSSGGGGGLFNSGSMTLLSCAISENSVLSPNFSFGCGVQNEGLMVLGCCVISNNSGVVAIGGGAGIANGGLSTNSTILLTNCTVVANRGLGAPFGNGGGLYNGGVAVLASCLISTNAAGRGGGIWNGGIFEATNCTVADNRTEFDDWGGGFYNQGIATLRNCSVLGNSALSAGGIWNEAGTLAMTNCTIAENWYWGSVEPGAGGGLLNSGTATLVNTTVCYNNNIEWFYGSPGPGYNLIGAGIENAGTNLFNSIAGTLNLFNCTVCRNGTGPYPYYTDPDIGLGVCNSGKVIARNSIIAGNGNTYAVGPDFYGSLTSEGYNLIGDTNGCTIVGDTTGNLLGVDPVLGPLDDYGGPTMTMPLLAGSPAIDAGDTANAPATDQRGHTRPYGAASDIGAFESSPPYTIRGHVYGFTLREELPVAVEDAVLWTTNGGYYRVDGLGPGNYSVYPISPNYLFVPTNQLLTVGPDRLWANIKAYHWNMLSLDDYTNSVMHIVFPGTNGQPCRLFMSADLHQWTAISTNIIGPSNYADLFLPVDDSPQVFFRAADP
jgi:hypothetical protein